MRIHGVKGAQKWRLVGRTTKRCNSSGIVNAWLTRRGVGPSDYSVVQDFVARPQARKQRSQEAKPRWAQSLGICSLSNPNVSSSLSNLTLGAAKSAPPRLILQNNVEGMDDTGNVTWASVRNTGA